MVEILRITAKLRIQAWAASASVEMKDAISVSTSKAHYPHTFIDSYFMHSCTCGHRSVVVCIENSATPSGSGTKLEQ